MSVDDKVGQMLMIGFSGASFAESDLAALLRETRAGGLVLLERNVAGPQALASLTAAAQDFVRNQLGSLPLFIAIDQEGGTVTRLRSPFTEFPSAQVVGASCDPDLTRRLGRAVGEEMKFVGLNMDLAPDLDVGGSSPPIGSRSFGPTAQLVSQMGTAFIDGLHDAGVIATTKHFPGHGSAPADSHTVLPIDRRSAEVLRSVDIQPFADVIKDRKVDVIMTAHIWYPSLDRLQRPATLSPAVVGQLLRDTLGYDGVVMTDGLTMGAVTNDYTIGSAAVEAVLAGVDILLLPSGGQEEARQALLLAAKTGTISSKRLDQSVRRILDLKQKYKLGEVQSTANSIGSSEHRKAASCIR